MVRKNKQMVDAEKMHMSVLTEQRRLRLIEKYGEVIANEIAQAIAEMEESSFLISTRAQAEALERNTAAIEANTEAIRMLQRQEHENAFDKLFTQVRESLDITNLERGLLCVPVPADVELRDHWHLWTIWKENRIGITEQEAPELNEPEDTVETPPQLLKPKRTNWGWKRHTREENEKFLFSKITEFMNEEGKLPTAMDFYKFYQSGYGWGLKEYSNWQGVIDAYIKAQ